MNYIVLDLEWNQPAWRGAMVEKPVHLVGEIVQIGAVRLNKKFRIKKELRLGVAPKFYKKLHRKVSRITGLTAEDLKNGLPFDKAMKKLRRFCGKNFVFLTWGPDDIPMLLDNLRLHAMDDKWVPEVFDLQVFFAHQIAKQNRQFALEDAMEMLGEGEFRAHDALEDAHSTAIICRHLNMEEGMKNYASLAGDITSRPLASTELRIRYRDKGEALKELRDTPFDCPACDGFLTPETMIPQNPHKYLSLATCSAGERYLVRFKLYQDPEHSWRATREVYTITEALRVFYEEKDKRYTEIKRKEREREKEKRRRKKRAAAAATAAKN